MKKSFFKSLILSELFVISAFFSCASYQTRISQKFDLNSNIVANNDWSLSYELLDNIRFGKSDVNDERKNIKCLSWDKIQTNSESSFDSLKFIDTDIIEFKTSEKNNNERFIYQQIKLNFSIPANRSYEFNLQCVFDQYINSNSSFCGQEFHSSVQMFNFDSDVDSHPKQFDNLIYKQDSNEPSQILSRANSLSNTFVFAWSSISYKDNYKSDAFSYTFKNDTNQVKTFSKYVGISCWIRGESSSQGDTESNIKCKFNINPKLIDQNIKINLIEPSWLHYKVGEKLDLTDARVLLNDGLDVTKDTVFLINNIVVNTGYELSNEGQFCITVKYKDEITWFNIYVESEPKQVYTDDPYAYFGDIKVKFKLLSNQTCELIHPSESNGGAVYGYVEGEGTLIIPDHVDRDGVRYFIKQIPSNWSDGENDITGIIFADDVSHLKIIDEHAFKNTNCLDYYNENTDKILKFPEGLEEIKASAFYGTFYTGGNIKGYDFPSTLKIIENNAFDESPTIGACSTGELYFRGETNVEEYAFYKTGSQHKVKYIYGITQESAESWANLFRKWFFGFETADDLLIPCVIQENKSQKNI